MEFNELLDKLYNEHDLEYDALLRLVETKNKNEHLDILKKADELRRKTMGEEVHLRGLIEFSSHCRQNCFYCGLRRGDTNLSRYRLEPDEIIKVAEDAYKLGYRTVVLQSGEDTYYDVDKMVYIINGIKRKADVAITLSIGERPFDEFKKMKEAGADRYLMRFETADRDFYARLHPGMSYADRINCLKIFKELKYEVGSGFIVGLPGETSQIIVQNLMLVKKLNLEMVGIGPFIMHDSTPLSGSPNGSVDMTLRLIALIRLLLPYANVPATTALGTLDMMGRQKGLNAGANVVMPNVMPPKYRPKYQIYPAKICIREKPENCRMCIEGIIGSLGRKVGTGYGGYKSK